MVSFIIFVIVISIFISFIQISNKKQNRYKKNNYRNYEQDKKFKNVFKPNFQQQELKRKGEEYERYVSVYFKNQGYTIAEHGIDNGTRDHGIDIIAKREKEIIFIQCKNWKVSEDYKINHRHIKEFIGNCTTYIEKNPMFGMCTIKRYFVTSNEIMDYSAERFISENPQSIQKLLLQIP